MKKQETNELIQSLKKKGKKENKKIYLAIAKNLLKTRKNQGKINLWKLSKLAEKNKGKTLVVCGKVLGTGNASPNINAYAFEVSEKAEKKLIQAKAKINSIKKILEEKNKELILVK
jgi:ribosomal protein L18E